MKNNIGFYVVNGVRYSNKIQAILEAQKTLADISWEFYNDEFNKINWQEEPTASLEELYKIRCQQIRNEYDYIVVMCSGGADSTNVIRSFLNNNIHVDEVVGACPMSGLNNWDWDATNKSVSNTITETKYALLPLMNEIATKYPETRVTQLDYFEYMTEYKTDEWLYECQDWVNPVINAKGKLDKLKHLVALADQGKRIGIVWGIDKPILRYQADGSMFTMITDIGVNNAVQPFKTDYPNVDRILFYWGPELPSMLVKQSHVLARYIYEKENRWLAKIIRDLSTTKFWTEYTNNLHNDFDWDYTRAFTPAIYPNTYDANTFQCSKSAQTFLPPQHDWFNILHKGTYIHQMVESDFNLFYKNLNPKYLNLKKNGFKKFDIKFNIGHYSKFLNISDLIQ